MKEQAETIDEILDRYPGEPRYLISLLQDIQAEHGYISREAMTLVCGHTGVPLSRAWAASTFYKSFSVEPRGEHTIKVCLGTACHLKGGTRLAEGLERELGVKSGCTTKDLRFSLDTVNCLGACALAPVVVLDEEYLPNTNSKKVKQSIKRLDAE
ncbi:NADH-quinone oxidoreductase, E subunit [uncultured Desulfobacterium sp.]|uniref:NADH-quinone oxidoreductase, E subunit n=1 Tax=uncultured Desulfobacterium sp. TaxID=201089 RepID=A0A445MR40_9BACT|nr:NADH-quinone oxidoreductase, E subunit [uncultured Desulfobacterium sp.]